MNECWREFHMGTGHFALGLIHVVQPDGVGGEVLVLVRKSFPVGFLMLEQLGRVGPWFGLTETQVEKLKTHRLMLIFDHACHKEKLVSFLISFWFHYPRQKTESSH